MTVPRLRIAPSPTGALHVGTVRTALYNFLYARRHGGVFLLRLEDTDLERSTEESVRSLLEGLRWLGLDWDEGPEVGGPYGPYRQSQRGALYAAVARRLEAAGHLWRDPRSPEELDRWRAERRAAGLPPTIKAPDEPLAGDGPAVLRLRLPAQGEVVVHDLVRGEVVWEWANVADPVLVRSDGSATYPLANTVDDVAQGITLVCRGEDLLSVTPIQVYLYDLLTADGLIDDALAEVGLPARASDWTTPSAFAHLSVIVGEDRRKLSKRHGAVSIEEFRRQGYLPEALVNYIALLGWAPGDGRERMDLEEMIAAFDFDHVSRAPAMFDPAKLTAFNGERIRALPDDELARRLVPYLDGTYGEEALLSRPPTPEQLRVLHGLVPLIKERIATLAEAVGYARPFLRRDLDLDPDAVDEVLRHDRAGEVLEAAAAALAALEPWTAEAIEAALRALPEQLGLGARRVFQPIRVAVTGSAVSPPLFESLALLDRELVLERLAAARKVAAG